MKLTKNKVFWWLLTAVLFVDAPISCVPQIVRMIHNHSSADVAISSWLLMSFFSFLWVLHGINAKDYVRTWASTTFLVSELLVAIVATWLRYLS